jgi:hypothetical protein
MRAIQIAKILEAPRLDQQLLADLLPCHPPVFTATPPEPQANRRISRPTAAERLQAIDILWIRCAVMMRRTSRPEWHARVEQAWRRWTAAMNKPHPGTGERGFGSAP